MDPVLFSDPSLFLYRNIYYKKAPAVVSMNLSEKIRWDIQRRSFSNRGIWRWIHQLAKSFDEIRQTLNDR